MSRTALAADNLALRQQLAVLNRKIHRPQLHLRDRFFLVILSQLCKKWREVLIIVKPEIVIKWHRQGFKLYWRWKSKAPVGRPKIDKEICELIKRMSLENSLWGMAPPHFLMEIHIHLAAAIPNGIFIEYIPQLEQVLEAELAFENGYFLEGSWIIQYLGLSWLSRSAQSFTTLSVRPYPTKPSTSIRAGATASVFNSTGLHIKVASHVMYLPRPSD